MFNTKPYYVQRLKKPFEIVNTKLANLDDAFSPFGGGYVHGGFKQEAWDTLKSIMRFDYMGAAEFEFGEVPRAFQKVGSYAVSKTICFGSIQINLIRVNYICEKNQEEDVKKFIMDEAQGKNRLKEATYFGNVVSANPSSYAKDVCGWLELDNGFMFFTNEKMFIDVKNLLENLK